MPDSSGARSDRDPTPKLADPKELARFMAKRRGSAASRESIDADCLNPPQPLPNTPPKDSLAQAGEEIVACYRQIEEAWTRAEIRLAAAHPPAEVRIMVRAPDYNPDSPTHCSPLFLAYARYKGEWRICVIEGGLSQLDDDSYRAVTECPVEQRLAMFDHFVRLHDEVLKTTKDYVPKVRDRVARFLASLEALDS
jgi:hypothetical protein